MADDDKVLAALGRIGQQVKEENEATREEVRVVSTNFELMRHEVTNHGKLLVAHAAKIEELQAGHPLVPTVDQIASAPLPRPPMTTLETIEQPQVSKSIRAIDDRTESIDDRTQKAVRENRWLTIAVLVIVPIVVAVIQSCGHH